MKRKTGFAFDQKSIYAFLTWPFRIFPSSLYETKMSPPFPLLFAYCGNVHAGRVKTHLHSELAYKHALIKQVQLTFLVFSDTK